MVYGAGAPFIVQMTPVDIRYAKRQMLVAMIDASHEPYENRLRQSGC
ncbi:MAG: hypothetical protein JW861_14065 [Bacteroidales bacterium]|nr:hypothetical protein [Bacteroidales bacterium]